MNNNDELREAPQNSTRNSQSSTNTSTDQSPNTRKEDPLAGTMERDEPENSSPTQDGSSNTSHFPVEEHIRNPNALPAHATNITNQQQTQQREEAPPGKRRRVGETEENLQTERDGALAGQRREATASEGAVEAAGHAESNTSASNNGIPTVDTSVPVHLATGTQSNGNARNTEVPAVTTSSSVPSRAYSDSRTMHPNSRLRNRQVPDLRTTDNNSSEASRAYSDSRTMHPNSRLRNRQVPDSRTMDNNSSEASQDVPDERPVNHSSYEVNVSDYPPEILQQVERARRQFGLPPDAPFQVNRNGNIYQVVLRTEQGTLRGNWPGPSGVNAPERGNRIIVRLPSSEPALAHPENVIRDIPLESSQQQRHYMVPGHAGLRIVPGENGQLLLRIVSGNDTAAGSTPNFFQNSNANPRMVSIRVDRDGLEGRVAVHLETEDTMRPRNQIPPLEPVALPDRQQAISGGTLRDVPDTDRFICGICYEYMEKPSSCGQCSGRFCKVCLIKVKQSQRGLCPTCRKSIEHIEEDTGLSNEMDEIHNIPCRFEGCGASLSLRQVKHHEHSECRMVSVFCRYKEYGCAWKGRRCDLLNHEEKDCALAKVSGLVDRIRAMNAERDATAREVAMRMSTLGLAVNHEREMTRRRTARSRSNPIDVVSFAIQVTCCSPSLIQVKDAWTNFYASTMARAAVFNFVTLIPTYLLVARLIWVEYTKCVLVLRHPQFSFDSVDDEAVDVLIDSVIGIVALTLVALLVILSLLFDNKSSEDWGSFEFPFLSGQVRVILCTTAVSFFLMYSLIFTMVDGMYLPAFLALVLFMASALLPTAIASFSRKLSRSNSPPLGILTGRIGPPLLFGLRYAFIVHVTDAVSCFDALCLLHFLDGPFQLLTRSLGYKEFFPEWPPFLDLLFVSIGIGRGIRALFLEDIDDSATANWGAACVLILLVNTIISRLTIIFDWVGVYHYQVAEASRSNNSSAELKANVIGLGLLSLTICSYILLATF